MVKMASMSVVEQQNVLRVGALEYMPRPDGWLTDGQATYALRQLWALVAGNESDSYQSSGIIQIESCCRRAPLQLLKTKCGDVATLSTTSVAPPSGSPLPFDDLPILFATTHDTHEVPCRLTSEGRVRFHVDLVALTFFLLTRWEEAKATVADHHGRFPASASVAQRHRFLQRPILDEWAAVLRKWVAHLQPNWEPKLPPFSINLTCDVDHPLAYPGVLRLVRRVGSALVRQRDLHGAFHHVAAGVGSFANWRVDPYYRGLTWLLELAERHDLTVECNFMTARKSQYEEGYRLNDPRYSAIALEVLERGHGIGFHAGYDTHVDIERFDEQKRQLESLVGQQVCGGRQHYLQFDARRTWGVWEQAGMTCDSTVGFADAPGFRCGTCRPFATFDLESNCPLNLVEYPLLAMDVSLLRYQQMSESEMTETLLNLGNQCRWHGGTYTLLIHNDMCAKTRRVFQNMLAELAPHSATSAG